MELPKENDGYQKKDRTKILPSWTILLFDVEIGKMIAVTTIERNTMIQGFVSYFKQSSL